MLKFIFWFNIGLVFYIYFGYPLTLLILARLIKKSLLDKKVFIPTVSLLIPAFNEEKSIRAKIENSLSLKYPTDKLEIIVISDGSTDKTEDITKEYLNQGVKLIVQDERKGKMAALNRAVPSAKGEIVVFSDANTMYDRVALKNLLRNFADEKVGCVGGNSRYIAQNKGNIEHGGILYTNYERFLWNMESNLRSLLVVHGGIYALRKSLFTPIDEALADDFVNPLRVAAKGYGVVYEPEAKATEKVAEEAKEEFIRKVRVISQGYLAFIRMFKVILSSGYLRIIQYFVHKFLRWLVPLFLIILFISNLFLLDSKFFLFIFSLQIAFYMFAIWGYWLQEKKNKLKIFYIPFYFCLLNTASLLGLLKAIAGKQRGIWSKAETTR